MRKTHPRRLGRLRRHARIRKTILGTSERPRLVVHRSARHISAQIIDDLKGATLVQASSFDTGLRPVLKSGGNVAAARTVGAELARRAKAKSISAVIFDRGGYRYHGRVKALADAAREGGLEF